MNEQVGAADGETSTIAVILHDKTRVGDSFQVNIILYWISPPFRFPSFARDTNFTEIGRPRFSGSGSPLLDLVFGPKMYQATIVPKLRARTAEEREEDLKIAPKKAREEDIVFLLGGLTFTSCERPCPPCSET